MNPFTPQGLGDPNPVKDFSGLKICPVMQAAGRGQEAMEVVMGSLILVSQLADCPHCNLPELG